MLIKLLIIFLPWPIKKLFLSFFYGYTIHPKAKIGFSYVYPDKLIMGDNSFIGHLNVIKGLSLLHMENDAIINRLNWITGHPLNCKKYFLSELDRKPELHLAAHSAITNRHLIDCTNTVNIGQYSIVAGFRSQILTHTINFDNSTQSSAPISIGEYCFIGTGSIVLKGSKVPNYSIVGALSLVNKSFDQEWCLYAGTPARKVKLIDRSLPWFHRPQGRTM